MIFNIPIYVSIIFMIILVTPTIKYWNVIFSYRSFNSGGQLWMFTILHILFDICLINTFYYTLTKLSSKSIIPYFILIQYCFFTYFTIIVPIEYNTHQICNAIDNKFDCLKLITKIRKKLVNRERLLNFIKTYFIYNLDYNYKNRLKGKNIKKFIIFDYFLSGIITASDIANNVYIQVFPQLCKQQSHEIDIETLRIIYNNELQLYSNVFIISLIPIIITYILNKSNTLNDKTC